MLGLTFRCATYFSSVPACRCLLLSRCGGNARCLIVYFIIGRIHRWKTNLKFNLFSPAFFLFRMHSVYRRLRHLVIARLSQRRKIKGKQTQSIQVLCPAPVPFSFRPSHPRESRTSTGLVCLFYLTFCSFILAALAFELNNNIIMFTIERIAEVRRRARRGCRNREGDGFVC